MPSKDTKDSKTHAEPRAVATPAPVAPPAPAVPAPAGVVPPQRQTLPADKQPNPAPGPTSAPAVTSESNFNQAKTTGEHRDSERKATDEAEAQKKAHPGGLPLPTSGQPVTRPEPDQR